MSEDLLIEIKDWAKFDSMHGQIKEAIIRKTDNGPRKSHSVIIWSITNKEHPQYGKYFIVEPQRKKSLEEWLMKTYDSIDDAKPDAERIFAEHIEHIKAGRINWWSRRKRGLWKSE